ncbi:MAG: 2-amino-4-hydroxy-6-hydroxymethyldihydropteridine diphosphokinase [Desulfomonile tiedjei]|nr:2-amino-4-hydroxy-6-hydroxymethyldihydropteridine diphosphokinase [Desulfomonile tiedjei]
MSALAYVGFGANLGDRRAKFHEAVAALTDLPRSTLMGCSRLYRTEPVGLVDDGNAFLNAVIAIETELSPRALAESMRKIERDLGKSPAHRSDRSRTIDLDLLLYGEEIIKETDLIVPHPRMHERAFVLVPLAELAPDVRIPTAACTVAAQLGTLPKTELEGVRVFATETPEHPRCS